MWSAAVRHGCLTLTCQQAGPTTPAFVPHDVPATAGEAPVARQVLSGPLTTQIPRALRRLVRLHVARVGKRRLAAIVAPDRPLLPPPSVGVSVRGFV